MNETRIKQILTNIQLRANEKFNKRLWIEKNPDEDLHRIYDEGSRNMSLPSGSATITPLLPRSWTRPKAPLIQTLRKKRTLGLTRRSLKK